MYVVNEGVISIDITMGLLPPNPTSNFGRHDRRHTAAPMKPDSHKVVSTGGRARLI